MVLLLVQFPVREPVVPAALPFLLPNTVLDQLECLLDPTACEMHESPRECWTSSELPARNVGRRNETTTRAIILFARCVDGSQKFLRQPKEHAYIQSTNL